MSDETSRTWAEISLDNIQHNYKELRRNIGSARFLGVVKADAYNHGAVKVASLLQSLGCDYLATATIFEALELRESGINLPILILGYTPPDYADRLIKNDLTQSISSLQMGIDMSRAAEAAGGKVKTHIKIDSGMGRFGFSCVLGQDHVREILEVMNQPGLYIEGVFTHFAVSEIQDPTYTREQFNSFLSLVNSLESQSGKSFKIKHCSNSGATLKYDDMRLDMVRPGIALYGCAPGDSLEGFDLRPAMELKTRVVSVKTVPAGGSISYGRTYTAKQDRQIAVIPIGYADGLHRVLSNKLEVLIHGKRAPQVGNICMDLCMIDVTEIPDVSVGDIVTIFGRDGDNFIPVEDLAEKASTISYEMLCSLKGRVPKVYK